MGVFEQWQPASFKGVSFLVNTETKTGGKKTVTHEYVGSDKRFTEELGLLPPLFTIEAKVHGEDAIQQRLELEKILDEPGLGTLIHPIYGAVEVKSTTYIVNSNQTDVGEFRFSLNFETTEAIVTLDVAPATVSTVSDNAGNARTALDNAMEAAILGPDVPGYTPDVLSATSEKIIEAIEPTFIDQITVGANSIYDTIFDYTTGVVSAVRSKVATFTSFVSNARSDMLTIVQQPFEIKNNVKDFYAAALNIVNSPSDLSEAWDRLIDFGFLETPIGTDTVIQQNTENNKSTLNEHTRLTALVNLNESSADKDYTTEEDIDAQNKVLDDGYRRLMENFGNDLDLTNVTPLAMDADFKAAMTTLRANTKAVLDAKRQNAYRVVTINPGTSSMALTAYRYYGDHEELDELQDLNPNSNHANFIGNIQAVSS
jgi:prophage DNA circulation protein